MLRIQLKWSGTISKNQITKTKRIWVQEVCRWEESRENAKIKMTEVLLAEEGIGSLDLVSAQLELDNRLGENLILK